MSPPSPGAIAPRQIAPAAPPLSAPDRARGRRIAISSHPAGMTFWLAFTQHLPTLALVSLGASETMVGVQNAFTPTFQVLQLAALRMVARFRKRHILIAGQIIGLGGALPLVFFDQLARVEGRGGAVVALACFAIVALGFNLDVTVWFSMLRSYVEPARIARFFGILRSGWSLALILYYLAAHRWLSHSPDGFAVLFAGAWLCGLLRIAGIARLPERSERTGERILASEALALIRDSLALRRYLLGITSNVAIRNSVIPFAIVMMRREIGFSTAEVVVTTISYFVGSFVSLYLWGRVVDRVGPEPVFRWTCIGMAALTLILTGPQIADTSSMVTMSFVFFGLSALTAGFNLADTRVIFELAPPEAPARTLVVAQVVVNGLAGLSPIIVGLVLERALATTTTPLDVYRSFFIAAAGLQMLCFLPLRYFRKREPSEHSADRFGSVD